MISALRRSSEAFEDFECAQCHVPLLTMDSVCPVCKQKNIQVPNTENIILELFPKSSKNAPVSLPQSGQEKGLLIALFSGAVILGGVGFYLLSHGQFVSALSLLALGLLLLGAFHLIQQLKSLHQAILGLRVPEDSSAA